MVSLSRRNAIVFFLQHTKILYCWHTYFVPTCMALPVTIPCRRIIIYYLLFMFVDIYTFLCISNVRILCLIKKSLMNKIDQ